MNATTLKSFCYHCGKELDLPAGVVGRSAECVHCRADVRCCYNCIHYDKASYNECNEPMAERVVDKTKANFCDYFSLRVGTGLSAKGGATQKNDALKKLDDLFKK